MENPAKILIHQDDVACSRILEETKIRQRLLNNLTDAKLSGKEIEGINSQKEIDRMIFERHLQVNKALAREYAAGKRAAHLAEVYVLPDELAHIKGTMEAWLNYPLPHRGFNKFSHLQLANGRYELDQASLEREFIINKYKIYGDDRVVTEIKKLDDKIEYYLEKNAVPHQILSSGFWADRLVCDSSLSCNQLPQRRFMIKRAYLLNLMERN